MLTGLGWTAPACLRTPMVVSKKRLKCRTNGKCDVSETCQDRYFHIAVENFALQILKKKIHEGVRILRALLPEGSRNIANDSDCYSAKLCILVTLQGRIEEWQECLDVGREVLLEG